MIVVKEVLYSNYIKREWIRHNRIHEYYSTVTILSIYYVDKNCFFVNNSMTGTGIINNMISDVYDEDYLFFVFGIVGSVMF